MFGNLPGKFGRVSPFGMGDNMEKLMEKVIEPKNYFMQTSFSSQLSFIPGEQSDTLIMTVPGFSKDDLQVTKDDQYLYIRKRDTKTTLDKIEEKTGQRLNSISDFYNQQFPLDFSYYDVNNIEVEVNDGILTVTLPKQKASESKTEVEIN